MGGDPHRIFILLYTKNMKKNFLFTVLVVLLAGFWFGGISLADTSTAEWDYIWNAETWNTAYNKQNSPLKTYLDRNPDEDRYNTQANRWAYDTDKVNGEWPEYCVQSWSGAISAAGAKYPWAVVNFPIPFTWIVSFSYDNWEPVYPWWETIRTFNYWYGVASIPVELWDEFLLTGTTKVGGVLVDGTTTFEKDKLVVTLIPAHILTIHYVYSNWDEAAEDYTWEFLDWADYSVASPEIPDYTADVATVSGTIAADVEVTVTYAKREMTITATKLAVAPDDLNKEDAQANQDAVTITQEWNNIIVKGKLDQLKTYNSTNPNQGEHQWVWIVLTTNLESITGAKWNGSQLTQADIDEGATIWLDKTQIIYWTKVDVIKDTPAEIAITASGYEDVNLTVSFEEKTEEKSTGTSWWGWGGWSSKTSTTDDTKAVTDTQDNTKTDENTQDNEDGDWVDNNGNADSQKALEDWFTQEFHDAYDFAFKNGITTMPSIGEADMNGTLTRIAMAKMLSQYAINVLNKEPDASITISFPDVSPELDAQYNSWVTLAYQLWIMGIWIDEFRPFDEVTRAEFVTALSRMLFGLADGENLYYETHMQKLLEEKIITVADPNMKELRGYVMIMLMRSAK